MSTELKIMSFNLRCESASDGENHFSFRKPGILELLNSQLPDVIGFQEVTDTMRDWLVEVLHGYYTVGVGREANMSGESSLIAYRKDRFSLCSADTVMLSSAPHVFGSRYDGSDQSGCPREYVRVCLRHRDLPNPFYVYNVHTDHKGAVSRMLASSQLLQDINSREGIFFLTGDFNAPPEAPEIQMITACRTKAIQDATASLDGTFHNYGRLTPPSKIDYIFTNASVTVKKAVRIEDHPKCEKPYLSDHNPIYIVAEL